MGEVVNKERHNKKHAENALSSYPLGYKSLSQPLQFLLHQTLLTPTFEVTTRLQLRTSSYPLTVNRLYIVSWPSNTTRSTKTTRIHSFTNNTQNISNMFFKSAALVAAAVSLSANAHLFISSPSPIAESAIKDPLDPSGANFPCHGIALPKSGGQKMAAGSQQLLAWDAGIEGANTAVHGGGSCQISITYETDPEKVKDPKNWYAIYSIEGGCPTFSPMNLDGLDGPDAVKGLYSGPDEPYFGAYPCTNTSTNGIDCISQFNFSIPKGIKSGHATLALTWHNAIGNRELYMNCASVELTGGDESELEELPSMFVGNMANLPGGQCPVPENQHVKFPYPGKYVTRPTPDAAAAKYVKTTYPVVQPTGAHCAEAGAPAGKGAGAAPPAESYPPAPSSAAASGSGGGMVTVTTMATVTGGGSSSTAAAPSASAPAVSSVAPSAVAPSSAAPSYPATPSGSSSSGSCANGKVPCSNPGGVVCISDTQFGLCNIDNCALPQPLAPGTHCQGGQILKRSHIRHAARHGAHRYGF